MKKVLIICTGNTCRSPMAEGILNSVLQKRGLAGEYETSSRGIAAVGESEAAQNAIEACADIGIDISAHRAKKLAPEEVESADVVFVMTAGQKELIASALPGAEKKIRVLSVPDPYGQDLSVYKKCAQDFLHFFEKEF